MINLKPQRTNILHRLAIVAFMIGLSVSFGGSIHAQTSTPTAAHDATIALEWADFLYQRVTAESLPAPQAARLYGYAGVTLYEAVVPGMPQHRSLGQQLHDMPEMPAPEADAVYDWPSVASSALSTVVTGLLPSTDVRVAVIVLQDKQITQRRETVPAPVVDSSLTYGAQVGEAILAWAAQDGFNATRDMEYTLPTGDPSFWQPRANQSALEPYWATLRSFVLPAADSCAVTMSITFSADTSSTFYQQAQEVYTVAQNLTDEEKEIATFWADNSSETGTPPGHWLMIGSQMVSQLGLPLDEASQMYALLGIAMSDGFISNWETKYRVNLLRPEAYIRTYIDSEWQPYIFTPPFPEYTSGHAVVSGAAQTILTHLFGAVEYTDTLHQSRGLPDRSFTSFAEAANEAAMSRLYGGIHFREGNENGLLQGACVGQSVIEQIQLSEE